MYTKELQACSYLVSLRSDALVNGAHYYFIVIYISFLI